MTTLPENRWSGGVGFKDLWAKTGVWFSEVNGKNRGVVLGAKRKKLYLL
jgi:hypothetical protein